MFAAASAVLTACDKIESFFFFFMLYSEPECTSPHAPDCTSYEFLSVHCSNMKDFLEYKVVQSLGPLPSSLSSLPEASTFRSWPLLFPFDIQTQTGEKSSSCLLMKGVHHHLVGNSVQLRQVDAT